MPEFGVVHDTDVPLCVDHVAGRQSAVAASPARAWLSLRRGRCIRRPGVLHVRDALPAYPESTNDALESADGTERSSRCEEVASRDALPTEHRGHGKRQAQRHRQLIGAASSTSIVPAGRMSRRAPPSGSVTGITISAALSHPARAVAHRIYSKRSIPCFA